MKTNFTFRNNSKAALVVLTVVLFFSGSCEVADDILGNEMVAAIEGEWSVDETSEYYKKSTMDIYSVTISADPDNPNGIIIDNFYNVNISVKATVSGNSITIPNQDAQDNYNVYGSGTISNNEQEISMNYVVDDGSGTSDHCTATYTKM